MIRTTFSALRRPNQSAMSQPAHVSRLPVSGSQDGCIHIEKINGPFLFEVKGTPAEYKAGLNLAIERGLLWLHESGTYVKLTESGAYLFAGRLLPKVACSQGVI
jgi:hypothetical protein